MSIDYLEWPTITIDLNGIDLTIESLVWIHQHMQLARTTYDTPFVNVLIRRVRTVAAPPVVEHQEVITPPVPLEPDQALRKSDEFWDKLDSTFAHLKAES